jgi:hypothetical protein
MKRSRFVHPPLSRPKLVSQFWNDTRGTCTLFFHFTSIFPLFVQMDGWQLNKIQANFFNPKNEATFWF